MTVVTTENTEAPFTLAQLTPAPPRSKRPWKIVGVAAAAIVVLVGALGWAFRPGEMSSRALGPLKADAARECRDAISAEARTRAGTVNRQNDTAAVSVSDVTVDEPRWGVQSHAWTVDGTFKFSIVSILGVVPGSVDVRCTATRSAGGQMVTSVVNR